MISVCLSFKLIIIINTKLKAINYKKINKMIKYENKEKSAKEMNFFISNEQLKFIFYDLFESLAEKFVILILLKTSYWKQP